MARAKRVTEGERKYLLVSLPQSNAVHLTAPSSEGAETAGVKFSEFGHFAAGAKFSEFGHPFVCFADISPIRGITPPYLPASAIIP